ncbi:MAG: hypothetical protein IT289_04765 [Oligoflexia bacterium]|nr:hypothetical protein [Oligoflexia bacterium]
MKKTRRALYTGPQDALALIQRILTPHFEVVWVEPNAEKLYSELVRCDVFIDASMKVPVSLNAISKAERLALVVTATTGADHIDHQALELRRIPLLTLKGQTEILSKLTAAAELSWALLMNCSRKLKSAFSHVEKGGWERTEFPGVMLRGKTLGLIGLGRIGSCMARYARAFEMNVKVYDPFITDAGELEMLPLDELLNQADVLSIHVPLNESTKGLLNRDRIERLKRGAIVVNTSRGAIIDEMAMVEALRSGQVSAIGVDVLEGEPEILKSPLWQESLRNPNITITPHIGGFAPEAVHLALKFTCDRVLKFFDLEGKS